MKKTTISMYIDPAQLKRLKERSAATGAPVSELIRRAIDAALKQWEGKQK